MFELRLPTNELVCKDVPTRALAVRLAKGLGDVWVMQNGGICDQVSQRDKDVEILVDFLLQGFTLELGPLILCPINRRNGRKFQVYCDISKVQLNELFNEADKAADLFLKIKKELHL